MMSNSDLQIWQDAVKGINETGKTDLKQEEWAALATLNGCLSSGDFSSDESRFSYQVLNDNLDSHSNNPSLYMHLYNFITLCYEYATIPANQSIPVMQASSTTTGTSPTPKETKQPGTLKNILFGAKGSFNKNIKFAAGCILVFVTLGWVIYALNIYLNMPGYVTTLVVGVLVSIAFLRKNQNGKIRENLAFSVAAACSIYMYARNGEQISGGYAFVWTFLGIGLIISFLGKNKPRFLVWLVEVIPATLCFLAFERLGGAISGFGAKDTVFGVFTSVRYYEAFKIFLLFCLLQSFANNAVVAQCRQPVHSKGKSLLFFGLQAAVVLLLLCLTLNPFQLPVFDRVKSVLIAVSQPIRAGADVFDSSGNKIGSATKTPISNALLCEHIPGYLATAYDFSYVGGFNSARITFEYDTGLGRISDSFQPRIYYFNESDGTLEELPNQEVQTDFGKGWASVSAKTSHFSTYILLNSVEYNSVWTAEIRRPAETDPCSCGSSAAEPTTKINFDVVFVIDESGSMQQNDRNNLRVEAAKQFIDMLEADAKNNRIAIYGFTTSARRILNLSTLNDKETVKNSLNAIYSDGGTNIYSGLQAAVQEIEENNDFYTPVIILMTDGQDNSTLTNYTPLIDRANAKGITVFAIGLGTDVNATLLRQICDNTGGGVYYYAGSAEVLPSIFKSANTAIIDYVNDSNGDGISDYYAQLLNDGTLRLSNGSAQFKGIDWVKCPADLDGDGLLNGEELVITGKIVNDALQVYVNMKSDPTDKNSKESITKNIDSRLLASFSSASYNLSLYGTDTYDVLIGNKDNRDYYSGWKKTYSNNEGQMSLNTDFWYQIYENGNDVVIAFRGTPELGLNPAVWGNWIETLILISHGYHPQDKRVSEEVNDTTKIGKYLKEGKRIYITGHSLGGHLAMVCYKEILAKDEGKYKHLVNRVETFNAVGITKNHADYIKANGESNKITQYHTCCDIATWASKTLGYYVKSITNGLVVPRNPIIGTLALANTDILYFIRERPIDITTNTDGSKHTHSNERGKASWWDWFTFSASYWTYELIYNNPVGIGIEAHKREHFCPLEVIPREKPASTETPVLQPGPTPPAVPPREEIAPKETQELEPEPGPLPPPIR